MTKGSKSGGKPAPVIATKGAVIKPPASPPPKPTSTGGKK